MATMQRRAFVKRGAAVGGGLAVMGPLGALSAQTAHGAPPERVTGYGPLVPKTDGQSTLMLPEEFDFITLDRQGTRMSDGNPTPGIFDGMGAFRGRGGRTILIRNHENREQPGETPVVVPDPYDPATVGGCTKVVVRHRGRGMPHQGGELRDHRRHEHELRGRRDPVGLVDHLRGGGQAR